MHETVTVHKLSEKRKLLGSRVVSKENDKDLGFNRECSCAAVWGQGAGEEAGRHQTPHMGQEEPGLRGAQGAPTSTNTRL